MAHRLAPQAEADLEDIAYYTFVESGSVDVADRFIDSLTERFLLLADYPYAGRRRDDLQLGIRGFPVGEYVILYRVKDADVVIVRVVRGSRDLDAFLGDE